MLKVETYLGIISNANNGDCLFATKLVHKIIRLILSY